MPESEKPQDRTDIEQLADALLAAVEEDIDCSEQPRSREITIATNESTR